VGVGAVQEVFPGMKARGCSRCVVVTTGYLTRGARELVRRVRCKLVDRDALARWVVRAK
jgi:HJR/Mrr/RecB family endonuclease